MSPINPVLLWSRLVFPPAAGESSLDLLLEAGDQLAVGSDQRLLGLDFEWKNKSVPFFFRTPRMNDSGKAAQRPYRSRVRSGCWMLAMLDVS